MSRVAKEHVERTHDRMLTSLFYLYEFVFAGPYL